MNGNRESSNESSLLALSQLKSVSKFKSQRYLRQRLSWESNLVTKLSEVFHKDLFEDYSSSSALSVLKARSCAIQGV